MANSSDLRGFLRKAVRIQELLVDSSDEVFFAVQQNDFPCVFTEFVHKRPVLLVLMDIAKGRMASYFKSLTAITDAMEVVDGMAFGRRGVAMIDVSVLSWENNWVDNKVLLDTNRCRRPIR